MDDFLNEKTRAEDIILGALGFGEDSTIVTIQKTKEGYRGTGKWPDGETFTFENECGLDELEMWALSVLLKE